MRLQLILESDRMDRKQKNKNKLVFQPRSGCSGPSFILAHRLFSMSILDSEYRNQSCPSLRYLNICVVVIGQ